MFAIVDCNNFYASCERLFRPDLVNQPIIVLSNNDGCVIARSNEAKALNIKMGQPYFQIKKWCERQHVHVFSSNYTLYGDLSARVMRVIEEEWPNVEVYSIDEAFLDLSDLPQDQHESFCMALREKIWKHVGIPTSIGIGATKTLAKAANYIAKKSRRISVFYIDLEQPWLELLPVEEVWGIGRQWAKKLNALGIATAADLKQQSPALIRQRFSLPLMQTTLELQGFACHSINPPQPRKSIMASKSFGQCQTEFNILAQAISHHCARATEKLRQQKGRVEYLSVFIRTNPFQERPQYYQRCQIQLPMPTDDVRIITAYAKHGLKKIFKQGFYYHKAGICFEQICYNQQASLLMPDMNNRSDEFMQVLEAIQHKYGKRAIYLAAEAGQQLTWRMKSEQRSPHYTTSWQDLPAVKIT